MCPDISNADGSVIINVDLNPKQAEKELAKLRTSIAKLQNQINDYQAKKMPLVEQAEALRAQINQAKREAESLSKAWTQGVAGADKQQQEAMETANRLEQEYNSIVAAIDKIDEKLFPAQEKLEKATVDAGNMHIQMRQAEAATQGVEENMRGAEKHSDGVEKNTRETEKNTKETEKHTSKLEFGLKRANRQAKTYSSRWRTIARSMLAYSLFNRAAEPLFQGFRQFTDLVKTSMRANQQATQAVAQFKGALLTMVAPIVKAVVPALTALIRVATQVVAVFARLTAAIFGTTIEESSKAADELWNEKESIDGVGSAAKKASKQLASFDEINKLTGDHASSVSGGSSSTGSIAPDFSALQNVKLPAWLESIATALEFAIDDIKFELADGFDFSDDTTLFSVMGTIVGGIVGGTLTGGPAGVVIGALGGLLLSLMLKGFQKSDKANGGNQSEQFRSVLEKILKAIVGIALLKLAFTGNTGMALLLSLGVLASLAYTAFKDDGASGEASSQLWTSVIIGILGAIVGAAFGGFKGAVLGLAIGMAISLAIHELLSGMSASDYQKYGGILYSILLAVFVGSLAAKIGGVVVGLGAGVLTLGIGLAVTFLSIGLSKIAEKQAKEFSEKYADIGGRFVRRDLLESSQKDALDAIQRKKDDDDEFAVISKMPVSDDISGLNDAGKTLAELQEAYEDEKFKHVPKASRFIIPKYARGAVIPPNREFLAVLGDQKSGTNVEAPLATIVQAMQIALASNGGANSGTNEAYMVLDDEVFGKLVYRYNNKERNRIGVSLAGGNA